MRENWREAGGMEPLILRTKHQEEEMGWVGSALFFKTNKIKVMVLALYSIEKKSMIHEVL